MAPKQPKPQVTEEPAAKKAKAEEPKAEEPKEEKFVEADAPKDNRPAITGKIGFQTADTTLNVVPTVGGKMLTCLTDGGMGQLFAGARANFGQKAGRYMFEAKIIQNLDSHQNNAKPYMRIGFSTSESGLIVGEDASSVYFDSNGSFVAEKKKTTLKGNAGMRKDQVVAVVLNLDSKSPNANTIALYRDGAAVGEPQKLPESLQGKTLFPHVVYRSASVRVNFGPAALKELPFKCKMHQGGANSDVVAAAAKDSKDGKYEVMMPVAFPDEGTFDWLDSFLVKNPQYTELSDRKIMQWAQASGHQIVKRGSNDKPLTGVREIDDMNVRKVINTIAPLVPRNYLIMEVKSNLVAAEREAALKKFNYPCYKKVARVVMGEPSKEWKAQVQNKLLKDKQAKSDRTFQAKKADAARKKLAAQKLKEVKAAREEAEKKRKAALAEKKKKEAEEKGEKVEEEEKKDEAMEEKKEEKEEEAEEETEAPTVELTDEEKKVFFAKKDQGDLDFKVMNASFSKFSTPEMDEGFDDIVFEWQKGDKAAQYLKQWVLNKKLTTRIEDIKPGKAFREKLAEFEKLSKTWQDKLKAYKAGPKKKAAKKADDEAPDDIDIFSVADVCDVADGVPLFDNFTSDDWELMKLRFQFCLLVLSFKADCNDADRAGIPTDHFSFYFQKYYNKTFTPKPYGCADTKEVIALIKDTVSTKDGLFVSQLSDDLDNLDIFLKLTEEQRRERQRRIDAGDETARLKFVAPVVAQPAAAKPVAKPVVAAATAAPAAAGNPMKSAAAAAAQQKNAAAAVAAKKGKGKW